MMCFSFISLLETQSSMKRARSMMAVCFLLATHAVSSWLALLMI